MLHFIGFRGEEYRSAVRVWRLPDVYHRRWDYRALSEIAEGDLAVFAQGSDQDEPSEHAFNDSAVF